MLLVAIGYMVQDVVADALTMFAIMASLMNLALSASQRYLNEGFAVSQYDYGNPRPLDGHGRRDRPRAVAGAAAAVARGTRRPDHGRGGDAATRLVSRL
jgi:hypothetical protein